MKNLLILSTLLLSSSPAFAGFVFSGPPVHVTSGFTAADGTLIWPSYDAQHRIVGGTGTSKYGHTYSFAYDPATLTSTYAEAGQTAFTSQLTVTADEHIVIHETAGTRALVYDIDARYGADVANGFEVRWWIYDGGSVSRQYYLPAKMGASHLAGDLQLLHQQAFGNAYDARLGYFTPLRDAVSAMRSDEIRAQGGGDPLQDSLIVVRTLREGLGAIGRGVVWGLAGVGGAVVVAVATTTPVGLVAYGVVFLVGFDASVTSDVISTYSQPSSDATGGVSSGTGGQSGAQGGGNGGGGEPTCHVIVDDQTGATEIKCELH